MAGKRNADFSNSMSSVSLELQLFYSSSYVVTLQHTTFDSLHYLSFIEWTQSRLSFLLWQCYILFPPTVRCCNWSRTLLQPDRLYVCPTYPSPRIYLHVSPTNSRFSLNTIIFIIIYCSTKQTPDPRTRTTSMSYNTSSSSTCSSQCLPFPFTYLKQIEIPLFPFFFHFPLFAFHFQSSSLCDLV